MDRKVTNNILLNGIDNDKEKTGEKYTHEESYGDESHLLTLNATYQEELRQKLGKACEDASDEVKLDMLRSHVNHLEDLNTVLISTVLELQKEVEERVILMEKRLKSSAKTTMEAVVNLYECEQEMSRILNEKHHMEDLLSDMKNKNSSLMAENILLRDQNFNYSHDIDALLHIIQNARSTGHWEMDSLTFCEVTPEQVFGPVQSLGNFCVPISETIEHSVSAQEYTCDEKQVLIPPIRELRDVTMADSNWKIDIPLSLSNPVISSDTERSSEMYTPFKSDTFCYQDEKLRSKSSNFLDFPCKIEKEIPFENSCEFSARTCYDSCLRRAYSEPHLFIFGQSIYVYKPCERPTHDLFFEDEIKFPAGTCQSIDLKLPSEDMTCKYVRTCKKDIFCNSKLLSDAMSTSLPCNMERPSLSSCTSDSDFVQNQISNDEGNSGAYSGVHCYRCSQNTSVSGTMKDFHSWNQKNNLTQYISDCVQTDHIKSYSIALQTDLNDNKPYRKILTGTEISDYENIEEVKMDMQVLKKTLLKTEDKVAGQLILIKELQSHLNRLTDEIEKNNGEIKDLNMQKKTLQDQKRSLLIQLDAQGDRVDSTNNELETCRSKLKNCVTQIEQQSVIIKSLQDALVQSKRAFDETKQANNSYSNKNILENRLSHNSKNLIVDL